MISAYAPTENADNDEKEHFYSDLSNYLQSRPLHNLVVTLGDFNARIGRDAMNYHSKVIGKYAYHQESNDNGNRLIDFCESTNMNLATTRQPHPNRHQWTWKHPNGHKAQLDHVLIRGKWINSLRNCRSYNTVEIDSDHRIVTARIKISFRIAKISSDRPIKYDHNMLLINSQTRSKFQLEVKNRFRALKAHMQIL